MAEDSADALEACGSLGPSMGQLVGGAAAVPAFGAGMVAGAGTGPGAVLAGAAAGYGAYDAVNDVVANNWYGAVCQPLNDINVPSISVDPTVFANPGSSPFSSQLETPFDQYVIDPTPVATVTFYDDPTPNGSIGSNDFGGGYSSGDSGGSGYSDGGGGGGGGDSGGSSSSD